MELRVRVEREMTPERKELFTVHLETGNALIVLPVINERAAHHIADELIGTLNGLTTDD